MDFLVLCVCVWMEGGGGALVVLLSRLAFFSILSVVICVDVCVCGVLKKHRSFVASHHGYRCHSVCRTGVVRITNNCIDMFVPVVYKR
jgi:hypothetical protein